jgi:hypothetical protein
MNYDYVMMGWFHSSAGRDSKLGLEIDRRERKKQRMKRPVRDAHRWEKVLSDGQNQMRPENEVEQIEEMVAGSSVRLLVGTALRASDGDGR